MLKLLYSSLFFLLCAATGTLCAQTSEVNTHCIKIAEALSKGDVNLLSAHFDERVTIFTPDVNNNFDKAHSKKILIDFFKKNPAQGFSFVTDDSSKHCTYNLVGYLKTYSSNFYVYVYYKNLGSNYTIQQILLEQIE